MHNLKGRAAIPGGFARAAVALLALFVLVILLSTTAAQAVDSGESFTFEEAQVEARLGTGIVSEPKGATETGLYLIRLSDPPLASYRGEIAGLAATSPVVTGESKLDLSAPASVAYQDYLQARHSEALSAMEQTLGRSLAVTFQYLNALNGMAIAMDQDEANRIAQLPQVAAVYPDRLRDLETDVSHDLIGSASFWDGDTGTGMMTRGEGVIVGMLDTGVNPQHPSFAATDGEGYTHTNPYGSGNFVGVCDPAYPDYEDICNDKLIGAWNFHPASPSAQDWNDHGSHVGSTIAGNRHEAVFMVGEDEFTRTIQGVAPRANVISYLVCFPSCPSSSSVAAVNQAIADGTDVLNYSIGGVDNPWEDPVDLAFLDAFNANIFVAASAGNDGPGASTVAKTGPWNVSVAASTHSRIIANTVDATAPEPLPPSLVGMGAVPGSGPTITADIEAEIRYAGLVDAGNSRACSAFPGGSFAGSIAYIQRGDCTFEVKVTNATAAGAIAVIVFNHVGGPPITMGELEATTIPAVFMDQSNGNDLRDFIVAQSPTPTSARINAGASLVVNPDWEDIMAGFSSRGPSQFEMLAPTFTAPGVNILAAGAEQDGDPLQYVFLQGTSMSSPHAAGAAALLKALEPDWSPAEIRSALASTAQSEGILKEDAQTPADPFDMGSGRLDLRKAARVGMVLDETHANFVAANPAIGGDPKTLNLPAMVSLACVETCSWTRTVKSVLDDSTTWTASTSGDFPVTVDPANFTLEAGATQEITVIADVSGEAAGSWLFAEIQLTPDDGEVSQAHFPLAVMPARGTLPTSVDIQTRRDAGSQLVPDLTAIEITELTVETFGLALGDQYDFQLDEDPTNSNPYNNLDEVWWTTVTVPAGAKRLVAEVVASTAVDIDLFVGTGSTPSAATEECGSTTPTFLEYCNVDDPAAGTWWVLVQNWAESTSPPDDVTTIIGIVPGSDAGNMTVTGPASVPVLEPFDLRVFWNEPAMEAGDYWYGAFTIGTDAANPGNVGMVRVDLERLEDDVTKVADTDTAEPGDTVNYTITVLPNVLNEDVTYWITDTIPAGLTYVPGSASASAGTVDVTGNLLTWTGTLDTPFGAVGDYVMTTNATDPSCDTPFGGYVNLQDSGILANPAVVGDTVVFTTFTTGDPINFYGVDYTGLSFTDDGFAIADWAANYGGSPWNPQAIPDADVPNNVLAAYWHDFELFYDAATNQGVSLATAGSPGGYVIIEYDNLEPYGGGDVTMDMNIIMRRAVNNAPGAYEIWFAYDNVASTPSTATIGVENQAGDLAVALVNNGDPTGVVTDGLVVCFDYHGVEFDPVTITYAVTVDAGASGTLTNNVDSTTGNPGSMLETTSAALFVEGAPPVYDVMLSADQADEGDPGAIITYNMVVTNTGNIADSFALTVDSVWDADLSATATGTLDPDETYAFTVDVTIPADAEDGDFDVATVTATSDGDPAVTDSAELTTTATVEPPVEFGVELSATTTAQSGYVGTTVVYTVDITNTGNGVDTFNVALAGHTWATTVAPANVSLQAGESAQLTVSVQIPLSAAHGAENTVTVTATSVGDPATSDSVQLTTTAQRYILFMPIIAKNG